MKKAFDLNVPRSKPKLRLGSFLSTVTTEAPEEHLVIDPGATSHQAVPLPIENSVAVAESQPEAAAVEVEEASLEQVVRQKVFQSKQPATPLKRSIKQITASVEVAPMPMEVQTPPPPELNVEERRERLKERLKAVRENPRPEPLPETVTEAGLMALDRIAALQNELLQTKEMNLALTQDLEAARRHAETATEEARLRMDEAKRLASEMEGRATLLADLEKELASLEAERNEALLTLQEARQKLDLEAVERDGLKTQLHTKELQLIESLNEEERLAEELDQSHQMSDGLRKAGDALRQERDTLAKQVAELTKERAELLEARKALQSVHRALSQAVAR